MGYNEVLIRQQPKGEGLTDEPLEERPPIAD